MKDTCHTVSVLLQFKLHGKTHFLLVGESSEGVVLFPKALNLVLHPTIVLLEYSQMSKVSTFGNITSTCVVNLHLPCDDEHAFSYL